MRREAHLLKTMTAVRECLDSCHKTPAPMTALARFVDQLRQSPQWQDAEVEEVETAARRAIDAKRPTH